jgi:hypothetical protein
MATNRVLRALLLGLAMARSADTVRRAVRTAVARLVLLTLAALTLLTGLGFLVASAYTAAAAWIGPLYANLAIGAALLLKAGFWLALSRRIGSSPVR